MKQTIFTSLLKWGSLAFVGLVVSPIVFLTIKGLLGLAVALLVSGFIYALTPATVQWLAQLKYGALKAVISRAPVEALIDRLRERVEALQHQAELLKTQRAELALFKSHTQRFIKDYPDEAQSMNEKLAQYEQLFSLRLEMFKRAKADNEAFARKVDKAEAVYEMAVADQKLSKSFGKQKDFDAYFREKVAFDEVDRASANSLASLEMALVDEDLASKVELPTKAVQYDSLTGDVLTGNILNVPVAVAR